MTYRLADQHGRSIVIRRPPLGNVLPSAHDMAREHRVLSGLGRVGYPAPAVLGLCEDESVTGCTFLVMDFVDGRIISTAEQADSLPADEADAVCGALVTALADLHRVDVEAAGLSTLGRPDGYLPRQLDRWTRQWDLTRTRDLPAMDALRTRLADLLAPLPADLPWSLVHGDYRLDNVILAPTAPEVLAVLDWEMSTLGDPLADLALSLVYWTQATDGLRHRVPVAEHLTDGPGFWDRAAIVEGYAAALRRSGSTTLTPAPRWPASSWPSSPSPSMPAPSAASSSGRRPATPTRWASPRRRWPRWASPSRGTARSPACPPSAASD